MAMPEKASYLRDVFIEYIKEKMEIEFFSGPSLSNTTNGFMLDSVAIEADSGFRAFSCFDTSPESFLARVVEDNARLPALSQTLAVLAKDPNLAKEVEDLLDEELKAGSWPVDLWKGKNIVTKVSYF